jgi:outer membrane lipoprotein-sorting protein
LQAVAWNAGDLKDFPLQIEMKEKGNTVRMHFTQLQFTKPDPQKFEVPAAYGLMK